MSVVALGVVSIALVGVVYLGQGDRSSAVTAAFVSGLPAIFAWIAYRIIDLKSDSSRIRIVPPEGDPLEDRVVAIWDFETCHVSRCTQSASVYAMLWGVSACLTLAGALTFHGMKSRDAGAICGHFAAALVASASVCFLVNLAQILVRIANDDASRRMFAVCFRTFVISLVTTVVLFFMAKQLSIGFLADGTGLAPFIGAGAIVALLGPNVLEDLLRRAGPLLGFKPKVADQVKPLSAIEGMTGDEAARLNEEGINSVEAIAYNPLPRMFFNTGFSLDRICDWHDQAILLSHVGVDTARRLRMLYGIRGASDLKRRLAPDLAGAATPDVSRAFEGIAPEQVTVMLESLRTDQMIELVDVFRRSTLQLERRAPMIVGEAKDGPHLVGATRGG